MLMALAMRADIAMARISSGAVPEEMPLRMMMMLAVDPSRPP